MRVRRAWAPALALWLVSGGPGLAQEKPRSVAASRPRDEVNKMVDAYVVSNLQESLGLTDEQFVRLLPLVKRLQTDRRESTRRRAEIVRDMRQLFESGTATEARIADLMRELKALEADEPAALKRDQDAIDAVLTPVQQAKLRVLWVRVEQRIRGLMNRWGVQKPGPAGRPGAPSDPP